MAYATLSEDVKARLDSQTNTVHGLPFEPFFSDHNHHEFHPYLQLRDDVTHWCQQHLTLERWHVGVFTMNGLYRFFRKFPVHGGPEGQGCRELSTLPIATINVMATNDHGQNWCHDHIHGECNSDIWHDCCARVCACQMMVASTISRVTDSVPSQRPTGALAKTLRSSLGWGLMQPSQW